MVRHQQTVRLPGPMSIICTPIMKLLLVFLLSTFSIIANSQNLLSNDPLIDEQFLFEFSDDSLKYKLIFRITEEIGIERYKAQFVLQEELLRSGIITKIEKNLHCWRSSELLATDSLGNTYHPLSCQYKKGETYYGLDFHENRNDFVSVLYIEMRQIDATVYKNLKLQRKD